MMATFLNKQLFTTTKKTNYASINIVDKSIIDKSTLMQNSISVKR